MSEDVRLTLFFKWPGRQGLASNTVCFATKCSLYACIDNYMFLSMLCLSGHLTSTILPFSTSHSIVVDID